MKKYLLMLCCAVVCAGFSGCSDDDDKGVDAHVKQLVGRWSCYLYEDWEDEVLVDSNDRFGDGADAGLYIMEFNADGTGGEFEGIYLSQIEDENNWWRFTFTLKGSQLIMREDDGYAEECSVAKITSSELVLAYQSEYDGVKNTIKHYFRRMK